MLVVFMAGAVGRAHAADLVLDPGHSPRRPGAVSCSGRYEYTFNDRLAARLKDFLAARGLAAVLSRGPDEELSLAERAALSAGKKLFLSVHHDAAQAQFMDYSTGYPCSRKAEGYSIFVSRKNSHYEASLAYARALGQALRQGGLRPSTHHGEQIAGEGRELVDANGVYVFDDLVVLKQAQCPALLLEAAVIVHPEDEVRAHLPAYQMIIARAVAHMLSRVGGRKIP